MVEVLQNIFSPLSLIMMNIGVLAGIVIGAMPGLSVVLAISLLLPMTFGMDSITGMYLLLGAYCGATYGGSITAILIKTPGTPSAAATVLDGYPMAKKGQAGNALKAALVGSTFGGLFSCAALLFFAPPLASMALKFGPPEYFALCMFGLAIIISISGDNLLKGVISASIGLFISTVGMDPMDSTARFMFGNLDLLNGFNSVIVMLGVFAISEMLEKSFLGVANITNMIKVEKTTLKVVDVLKHWKILLKSALFGTFIGAVPGTGSAISAFYAYDDAKRSSKEPEKFGTGCLEGIIAPETGNNAVTAGTLIPLLTLGIPGDAGVAILLGALAMQGIFPGPELFTENPFWTYSIMLGLFVINIFMFLQGNMFVKFLANVAKVPFQILVPCVLILCSFGAYSVSNSTFDVMLLLCFGLIGFVLKRFSFPIPPLTIALVLGQLTENNLRRSLILSEGSASIFFTRPISLVFILIAIASVSYPIIKKFRKK